MILKIQTSHNEDYVFFEADKFFFHKEKRAKIADAFHDGDKDCCPMNNWYDLGERVHREDETVNTAIFAHGGNDIVVAFEKGYLLNNNGQTIEKV